MLKVVEVTVRPLRLGGVALGTVAGAVEEKPGDRVIDGGLAGGVISVDRSALPAKADLHCTDTLEVRQGKLNQSHTVTSRRARHTPSP